MFRQVNIINASGIQVDSVKTVGTTVDNLKPRSLFHREIDEQRPMRQFRKRLKGHKFVIGLRRPGVYLNAVLQRYHKELDSFVFDYFEVDGALEVAYIYPAITTFDLLKNTLLDYT